MNTYLEICFPWSYYVSKNEKTLWSLFSDSSYGDLFEFFSGIAKRKKLNFIQKRLNTVVFLWILNIFLSYLFSGNKGLISFTFHPEVVSKKVFFCKFRKIYRKALVLESLFIKGADLKACNFIKKWLQDNFFL